MSTTAIPAAPPFYDPEARSRLRRAFGYIFLSFFLCNFAIPSQGYIGNLPIKYLLKDHLNQNAGEIAFFFAASGFAWYLKPICGFLSDSFPLFGTRRRSYVLLGSAGAAFFWLLSAVVPKSYWTLMATIIGINAMLVIVSSVLGGYVVEQGRDGAAPGRVSAFRNGALSLASLAASLCGGILAAHAFGWTAGTAAALLTGLFLLTFFGLPETARPHSTEPKWPELRANLAAMVQSKPLWWATAMNFIVIAAPGFGTPLFFYQTNNLHFSSGFIGTLGAVGGACGLAGGAIYYWLCPRVPLRALLFVSIIVQAASALAYLGYHSHHIAPWIDGLYGLAGAPASVVTLDLAARATPKRCEALAYSLMMAAYNFAFSVSDVLGSWLFSHFHLAFPQLIWINAAASLIALLAIPFLPRLLTDRRDGDKEPEVAVTPIAAQESGPFEGIS